MFFSELQKCQRDQSKQSVPVERCRPVVGSADHSGLLWGRESQHCAAGTKEHRQEERFTKGRMDFWVAHIHQDAYNTAPGMGCVRVLKISFGHRMVGWSLYVLHWQMVVLCCKASAEVYVFQIYPFSKKRLAPGWLQQAAPGLHGLRVSGVRASVLQMWRRQRSGSWGSQCAICAVGQQSCSSRA